MIASALAFAGLDFIRKLLAGRIDALALVFFISWGGPFSALLLSWPRSSFGRLRPPGLGALALELSASLGSVHSSSSHPEPDDPALSLTPVFTALTPSPSWASFPIRRPRDPPRVVGAMALNSGGSFGGAVRGLLREKGALISGRGGA
jgi:hypothetical protein